TIPVEAQSELSFAVSPDGLHLAASVFTFPPKSSNYTGYSSDPFKPGPCQLDIFIAEAGGSPKAIRHDDVPPDSSPYCGVAAEVVGWDLGGALISDATPTGTQNGLGERTWFGHISHMDATGRPQAPLGGPDCDAWRESSSGSVACTDAQGSD